MNINKIALSLCLAILLGLGCTMHINDHSPIVPSGPSGDLFIVNTTNATITRVTYGDSGSGYFGQELMVFDSILPGDSLLLTRIPVGVYDVKIQTPHQAASNVYFGMMISEGLVFRWNVTTISNAVTFTIVNKSALPVDTLYITPSHNRFWGRTMLVSSIGAGAYTTVTNFSPDTFDIQLVRRDGLTAEKRTVIADSAEMLTVEFVDTMFKTKSTVGRIVVTNAKSLSLASVHIRRSGVPYWGANRLRTDSLRFNDSLVIDSLSPGLYDVRVERADGFEWLQLLDVSIAAGNSYSWVISGILSSNQPLGVALWLASYAPTDTRVYTATTLRNDSYNECDITGGLQTVSPWQVSYLDTLVYSLSGSTLTVEDWDTTIGQVHIQFALVAQRSNGIGKGLEGLFDITDSKVTISGFGLAALTQAWIDTLASGYRAQYRATNQQIVVSASRLGIFLPSRDVPAFWMHRYKNSLQKTMNFLTPYEVSNATTLTIFDVLTLETVTLVFESTPGGGLWDYRVTMSSSNFLNAPGSWQGNPLYCPNEAPSWYQTFLNANFVRLAKVRVLGKGFRGTGF